MRRVWVVAVWVAFAGCELESTSPEALCTAVCDCQTSLASLHGLCVSACVEDIPPDVPEACQACILGATCAELMTEDACEPEC